MTAKLKQRQRQRQQPLSSLILTIVLFFTSTFLCITVTTEARQANKRFVIHVPFKVKTHHHTHTVYSSIHTGGSKQTIYKVIGYSRHGHLHGHGYTDDKHQQHKHHHQHQHHKHHTDDKYNYDMHHANCDDHKGDMVFNHYARNDKYRYYPNVEEYFEDEQEGDEWGERRSMGCYGC